MVESPFSRISFCGKSFVPLLGSTHWRNFAHSSVSLTSLTPSLFLNLNNWARLSVSVGIHMYILRSANSCPTVQKWTLTSIPWVFNSSDGNQGKGYRSIFSNSVKIIDNDFCEFFGPHYIPGIWMKFPSARVSTILIFSPTSPGFLWSVEVSVSYGFWHAL